jgi:C1A family cysteine protease
MSLDEKKIGPTSRDEKNLVPTNRLGHRLSLRFQKRNLPPDSHLLRFRGSSKAFRKLPLKVDLSSLTGPVRDQESIGCCVSFSMCTTAQYLLKKEKQASYLLSPLFLYYVTRVNEMGEIPSDDSGSTLEEAVLAMKAYGVCQESKWPFHPSNMAVSPSSDASADAKHHVLIRASPVSQDLRSIQSLLASGYTVNIGILLYQSFETDTVYRTGIVPLPKPPMDRPVGGHCVTLIGYDNAKQWFLFQNSWGTTVGNHGIFYIPYEYVLNSDLCSELWCLTEFDNKP